jgi:CreA protein
MRRFAAAFAATLLAVALGAPAPASAENIASIKNSATCLIACNRINLDVYKDDRVPGVACWLSRAVNGSWNPLSDDPSDSIIACRQVGPIKVDLKELKKHDGEEAFSQKTSIIFKSLTAYRYVDLPNNSIVYLLISGKLTDGSPKNSNSPVPVMPWPEAK